MEDSDDMQTTFELPTPRYKLGSEPQGEANIKTYSSFNVVDSVRNVIGIREFERIESSFLGPIIRASRKNLQFSSELVHFLLKRAVITRNKEELWVQYGRQPMRFSIREFHMATGLKCFGEERVEDSEEGGYDWRRLSGTHTLRNLEDQLKDIDESCTEERFCLGMLMIIEGIFLPKDATGSFPIQNIRSAQSVDQVIEYPWGKKAFKLLIKSVRNAVENKLTRDSYELHGFPMAIYLWALSSVPLLQMGPCSEYGYLCERFISTPSPTLPIIYTLEDSDQLKVTCILPPIDGVQDHPQPLGDENLESLLDILNKGYKLTYVDWNRGWIDIYQAVIEVAESQSRLNQQKPFDGDAILAKMHRMELDMMSNFEVIYKRLGILEEQVKMWAPKKVPDQGNTSKTTICAEPVLGTDKGEKSKSWEEQVQDQGNTSETTICTEPILGTDQNKKSQSREEQINGGDTEPNTPSCYSTFVPPAVDETVVLNKEKDPVEVTQKQPSGEVPSFELLYFTPPEDAAESSKPTDDHPIPLKKRKYNPCPKPSPQPANQFLRRSRRNIVETGQSGQSLRPRNPAIAKTPDVHPTFHPFISPKFKNMDAFETWKTEENRCQLMIFDEVIDAMWFYKLETPEQEITSEHVDAILLLLKHRRAKDAAYFHNNRLPKAGFLSTNYLKHMNNCYAAFKKKLEHYNFDEELIEELKDLSAEVLYGACYSKRWFGVCIDIKNRAITVLECATPATENREISISAYVKHFSEMFPYLLKKAEQGPANFMEFCIKKLEDDVPTTKCEGNRGLFAMKMIECHSMGIKDMKGINDMDSEDLRTKLAIDIFEEVAGIPGTDSENQS